MLICTYYGEDHGGRGHRVRVETYGPQARLAECDSCGKLMRVGTFAGTVARNHLKEEHRVRVRDGAGRPLLSRRRSPLFVTLQAVVLVVVVLCPLALLLA